VTAQLCYHAEEFVHEMANPHCPPDLKAEVREFWNAEPCGTRYLEQRDDFETHARVRYTLEPYISEFAQFTSAKGLRVLEIGVGMGVDYLEWLRAGALATGVDLSASSLEKARRRCLASGYQADLTVADAEQLPFPDNTFDIVYSYGVMHHSPNTQQCLGEAWRVLKRGGQARVMLYHHPSLTGLMLWLRYGLLRGASVRETVYYHLESPGTKTLTRREVRAMMSDFQNVTIKQVFSPGDLLLNQASTRFQSPLYKLIWKLYPRRLVRLLGTRLGLFLLITGQKPADPCYKTAGSGKREQPNQS
jgi:ubiquinone/menaquinone biosynthesis C-methylase UbiE